VSLPGGFIVSFKYDPFGRRIQKTSASGTVNYLYDGAGISEERDASGVVLARYAQGLGIDEPLAMQRAGTLSHYHADGLGSVTSLTDAVGGLSATYVYDSFGNVTSSTGSVENSLRYTGREWDAEIGIYYYRARTGRAIAKRIAKKLGRGACKKIPIVGIGWFLWDYREAGLAYAVDEAVWPVSEFWTSEDSAADFE